MKIGIFTGGGDCPGLNAVIRAIVRRSEKYYQHKALGFLDGWRGVIDNDFITLDIEKLRGTLPRGGTILGTSRIQPYMFDDGLDKVQKTMKKNSLDALIAIGGDGTLSAAREVHKDIGLPLVGVPKTIDNDIPGTELTFGFITAVQTAVDAIDRLHSTAESHDRIMVVEVMGRHAGDIATWAGIASGATITLVPEEPFDISKVAEVLKERHGTNRYASIVVVAEGAKPQPGTLAIPENEIDIYGHEKLGNISHLVAVEIENRTGIETRVAVLGHLQRGGSPTAFDRVLCSRFGVAAADAVNEKAFGQMVVLRSGEITRVSLEDGLTQKTVSKENIFMVSKVFSPKGWDD